MQLPNRSNTISLADLAEISGRRRVVFHSARRKFWKTRGTFGSTMNSFCSIDIPSFCPCTRRSRSALPS